MPKRRGGTESQNALPRSLIRLARRQQHAPLPQIAPNRRALLPQAPRVGQAVRSPPSAPRRAVAAAASGDLSAREQTAQTTTAGVVLCRLSTDHDGRVRTEVASNQSCSLRLLERLGEDPHHGVRSAVAANPNCPPATLKRLSEDSDGGVRHALAANEASPLELLEYLSNDSLGWVRHRVPCNPACPQPLLERLSSDPDAQMRKAVAANPECPRRLLKRLSRDTDADVRYQAHRTLKAPLTS